MRLIVGFMFLVCTSQTVFAQVQLSQNGLEVTQHALSYCFVDDGIGGHYEADTCASFRCVVPIEQLYYWNLEYSLQLVEGSSWNGSLLAQNTGGFLAEPGVIYTWSTEICDQVVGSGQTYTSWAEAADGNASPMPYCLSAFSLAVP